MSRVADGVRSAAIPGGLLSDEALRRLLNATGLGFELLNKRTVTIAAEKSEGAKSRTTPASSPTSATRNTGYTRFAQADTSQADVTVSLPPSAASTAEFILGARFELQPVESSPRAVMSVEPTDKPIKGLQKIRLDFGPPSIARQRCVFVTAVRSSPAPSRIGWATPPM